jgi:hypothetical protein
MTSATSPHLCQTSPLDQNDNNYDAVLDLTELKKRFDKHLPKYGFLWRSLANARLTKETVAKRDSAHGVGGIGVVERRGFQASAENTRLQQQRAAVDIEQPDHQDDSGKQASDGEDEDTHRAQAMNESGSDESTSVTFTILDAILNKRPVSLRVGPRSSPDHDELCWDGCCDCVDPIIEIFEDEDEDASAFDVNVDEELADTTDDDGRGVRDDSLTTSGADKKNAVDGVRLDETSLSDDDASINNDSDDSTDIVIVRKTPKKKMFILESDDEDDSDVVSAADGSAIDEHRNMDLEENSSRHGNNNDDSMRGVDNVKLDDIDSLLIDVDSKQHESSSNSSGRPYHQLHSLKSRGSDADIIDSSDSEREHEWIELSSDEDEEASQPPKRVNKVIILSDDDEEIESDNDDDDDHSVFTISDDSDGGEESDDLSFRMRTGRGPTNRIPSGGRAPSKTISSAKPTQRFTTSKENDNPNVSKIFKSDDTRSTLAFRRNRDALTANTFSEFNQRAFQDALSSVKVTWSKKLNKTAGVTRMRGKLGEGNASTRVATIELSTKVIDDEVRLRSTLLHEMCHAAQWLVDGIHKPPHGKNFKKWAAISMQKIRDVEVTTTHDYQIVYKYAWVSISFSH